jgi:hypothetical protein
MTKKNQIKSHFYVNPDLLNASQGSSGFNGIRLYIPGCDRPTNLTPCIVPFEIWLGFCAQQQQNKRQIMRSYFYCLTKRFDIFSVFLQMPDADTKSPVRVLNAEQTDVAAPNNLPFSIWMGPPLAVGYRATRLDVTTSNGIRQVLALNTGTAFNKYTHT